MSMSRYSARIQSTKPYSSHRPFAEREAIDCRPVRRLRWYHLGAAGGVVSVLLAIAAALA